MLCQNCTGYNAITNTCKYHSEYTGKDLESVRWCEQWESNILEKVKYCCGDLDELIERYEKKVQWATDAGETAWVSIWGTVAEDLKSIQSGLKGVFPK